MTCICYRNGILAADSRVSTDIRLPISVVKIWRTVRANGTICLIGGTGTLTDIQPLIEWVKRHERYDSDRPVIDDAEDGDAVIEVSRNIHSETYLTVFYANSDKVWVMPMPYASYYAIGVGSDHALGAMFMSGDATDGVQAASYFNPTHVGGDINTVSFEEEN